MNDTVKILQKTVKSVKFAVEHGGEDADNDAFFALVEMLKSLRKNNICIETLCEEAMQDDFE